MLRSRLEQSDALRASIEGAAESQLGVVLQAGEIEVAFWPPELRLPAPTLDLPGRVRAELTNATIAIELAQLFESVARVQDLKVDGPARFVHRDEELEGGLMLELIPAAPPAAWSITADFTTGGGRFEVRGETSSVGDFAGNVEIVDVEAAPLSALLSGERGEEASVSGRYSGNLDATGGGAGAATLRLTSTQTRLVLPPVLLEGPVALVAEFPNRVASDPAAGRFAIDASGARVEYAGDLAKASGRGASLTGRIVQEPTGRVRLEDVRLKVLRFEGEVGTGRKEEAH